MAARALTGELRHLGRAFLGLAYFTGLAGAAQRRGDRSWILMLHGTPRRRANALESVLRYVRRHFEVVGLGEIATASGDESGSRRARVALTFDDGLRNNVLVAYPMLRALGLPATFFVCPQLVDERAWLWNHEARLRLQRLDARDLGRMAGAVGAAADVESVIEAMKHQRTLSRCESENRLRRLTAGFSPTDTERHEYDLADWSELRSLDSRLVTVGSHTLTHPILPQLDNTDMQREVRQSRRQLEARLDRAVEHFAYPNGAFTPAARAVVARSYRAAVTVDPGYVCARSDRYLLPRVNVPWSRLRLALAMHCAPAAEAGGGSKERAQRLRPAFAEARK